MRQFSFTIHQWSCPTGDAKFKYVLNSIILSATVHVPFPDTLLNYDAHDYLNVFVADEFEVCGTYNRE